MRKFQSQIFVLLFIFAGAVISVFPQNNPPTSQDDAEIAEKVKRAFDPSRKYDYRWADEIKPLGKKIIPYLEPYSDDPDGSVRLAVLELLKNINEPESLPLLAKALRDPLLIVSREAALYLYDNHDHKIISQNSEIGVSLRKSLANGNRSLSAVVLLGYFPGRETEAALLAARDDKATSYWSEKKEFVSEIRLTVPVQLSLFRLKTPNAYEQLLEKIKTAKPEEIEFLLDALEFVDDAALLKLIFEKGIVSRHIPAFEYGIEGELLRNSMRVADVTVNRFARKLNLDFGFKLQESAYSQKKLNLARQKISDELAAR